MNIEFDSVLHQTRRHLLTSGGAGVGLAALATLLNRQDATAAPFDSSQFGGLADMPNFAPKAKRVIYLFQSGAPSQFETFDYKPELEKRHAQDLPKSFFGGQRLTGMTAGQGKFPVARSIYKFARHGKSGNQISELFPYLGKVADELCIINTLHTEAINHDPAITFFQTGFQQSGRPSIGAWLSYGLGTENQNLPAYIVFVSQGSAKRAAQPLFARLWGSGFLPAKHQGVKLRGTGDPVLYLSNPPGIDHERRRQILDLTNDLNRIQHEAVGDPEIATRIAQFELAYRMQTSVPELMDISKEPESVKRLYGPEVTRPGSYAFNCLIARRMAERGVRFIQLFHRDWDHHFDLPRDLPLQCKDVDQPSAGLIADLKQRGMLNDTLIVWGGEFGRTVYCQGPLSDKAYGRDHHPRCFSIWMAGGGIKPGITYGKTDEFSYNIAENPVHVYDLHATILQCLGIDHTRLTYKFQGRHYRLTDVHGNVVKGLLA